MWMIVHNKMKSTEYYTINKFNWILHSATNEFNWILHSATNEFNWILHSATNEFNWIYTALYLMKILYVLF